AHLLSDPETPPPPPHTQPLPSPFQEMLTEVGILTQERALTTIPSHRIVNGESSAVPTARPQAVSALSVCTTRLRG
ncbi:hypothetical protein Tco_0430102, partial [Tanacetum coccineum]